jgi:hypothetical protein
MTLSLLPGASDYENLFREQIELERSIAALRDVHTLWQSQVKVKLTETRSPISLSEERSENPQRQEMGVPQPRARVISR